MRKLLVFICLIWGCSRMDGTGAVVQACDEASLRAAIAQGGTVTFGCSGTITLTQAITITTSVTLNGVGAVVTISGGDRTRLFDVSPGAEFQLSSLRLTGGFANYGGAISNGGGRLVLTGVTVVSNNAGPPRPFMVVGPGAGGAVYSVSGDVVATDCTFASNLVFAANGFGAPTPARGGAICVENGSLTLTRCSFIQNSATGGTPASSAPGVPILGTDALGGTIFNGGTASVRRCTFVSNEALGGPGIAAMNPIGASTSGSPGGWVYGGVIHNRSVLEVDECTFLNNRAMGGQGGFGTPGLGAAGSGGSGGSIQGAVLWNRGSLSVSGSTFATNSGVGANGGFPGHSTGGAPSPGTVGGNGGWGGGAFGGAIFTTNGASAFITNCTAVANSLLGGDGQNGGEGAPCIATGCTLGGAGGRGGDGGNASGAGIFCAGGTAVIVHSTFDGNGVRTGTNGLGGPGGQGRTGNGARGADGNPGVADGGAFSIAGGSVEVANSIFARSSGSTNCSGRLLDLSVNISTDNSGCFTNPASMKNQDAGLAELADNGGPTPTSALLATSVALDRANDAFGAFSDARGVRRSQGRASDVGAFEAGYLRMTSVNTNAWFSYGAPPGTGWRLEGQANAGTWRDLGTTTADVRGYAHYGPIRMTNSLEVFRTRSP